MWRQVLPGLLARLSGLIPPELPRGSHFQRRVRIRLVELLEGSGQLGQDGGTHSPGVLRGLEKVDQMFVFTMAAYNLTRLRTRGQVSPQGVQWAPKGRHKAPGIGFEDEKDLEFQMQMEIRATRSASEGFALKRGIFQQPARRLTSS